VGRLMMMDRNESYKTAYVAAYARLIEQYEPKETRLFNDSFVKNFFSNYLSFIMKFTIVRKLLISMYNATSTGLFGLQVCRTKYIDERLKEAMDNGIEQVVILGAGFDTRLYRIPDINRMRGFEVDLSIIQDKKKMIIKKYLGKLPNNVVYTPIDFNIQTLDEVLAIKELDFSKPIFFIWEGVTQYITKEAISNTLKFISKASFGSAVVFTYALESVVDGTTNIMGAEVLTTLFKIGEQAWRFGLNPSEINNFIKEYNLELIEDVGSSYYQENYLKPIGRKLDVSLIERITYAKII
jgi:methyltransferase (TIGR00027 family)